MTGNDVQMLHDRLLRIEQKQDETLIRLGEGARRMDAIEVKADKAVGYGSRIEALEGSNRKAMIGWAGIVLAVSLAFEWGKKRLGF